jgi:hypothetical protein
MNGLSADEGFFSKAFKISSQVVSDFLLGGIGYFNNTGLPPLALMGLILGVLRLNPRRRKSKIVFILYWIGLILSIDFIYAVGYGLNASFGSSVAVTLASVYVALLIFRKIWKWPMFLTATQLLVVPVCLLALAVKSGEIRNPEHRCESISEVRGAKVLNHERYNFTDVPHTAIPRFFVPRPDRGDLLVCAHVYVHEESVLVKNAINRLDLKTGKMTEWHKRGNVLAIREESDTGIIYAVMQRNFRERGAPNVEFIVFSPEGDILNRMGMGLKRNTFYGAGVTIMPEKVFITVESNYYEYDKKSRAIEKLNIAGNAGTPVYRTAWSEPYLFGTFSVSPLFGKLFGSRHLLRVNAETRSTEMWAQDYPVGMFDVEIRPGKRQIAASRNYPEGAWLLDFDLNKLVKLVMPAGVREIEFSKDGRYLLGTSFFNGKFHVIDVEANKLVAETFVGYGSRGMAVDSDGNAVIGASCGVVGINLDEFLKGQASAASK